MAAPNPLQLCWGTAPDATLIELIDLAAGSGCTSISIRPAQYLDAAAAGITDDELRRRLDDAGVGIGFLDPLTAGLPNVPPASEVAPHLRPFLAPTDDDCWRAAEALGCPLVNATQFLGPPASAAALLEAFAGLAERAHRHGTGVCVEPIPGTGTPDLPAALKLHDGTDGAIGVLFDSWHFHRTGAPVDVLTDDAVAAIVAIQLNDATGPPPAPPYTPMVDRLVPGDGDLPLVAILRRLLKGRPTLPVGVEVFSSRLRTLPSTEAVATAVAGTRAVLSSVSVH